MVSQKGFMPIELLSTIFLVILAITIPVILNTNKQSKSLLSKAEQDYLATPSASLYPLIVSPTSSIASSSPNITPTIMTTPTLSVLPTIMPILTQAPTSAPYFTPLTPTPPPTMIESIINNVLNVIVDPFISFTTPTSTPIPTLIPIPTLTPMPVSTKPPTPSPTLLPTATPTHVPIPTTFPTATSIPLPTAVPTTRPIIPTQKPISTPIPVLLAPTLPPTTRNNVLDFIIDPFVSLLNTFNKQPEPTPIPTPTVTPLPTPIEQPKKTIFSTIEEAQKALLAKPSPTAVLLPTSIPVATPIIIPPTIFPSPTSSPQPPQTIVENIVNFIDNAFQAALNIFHKPEEQQPVTTKEKDLPGSSVNETNQTTTTYDYSSDTSHDDTLLRQIKNDKDFKVNIEDVESELTPVVGKENILVLLGKMTSQEFDEHLLPVPGDIQSSINNVVKNLYLKNSDNKLSFEAKIIQHWYKLTTSAYDRSQLNRYDVSKRILSMVLLDSENNNTIRELLDKQKQGRIVVVVAVDQDDSISAENFATLGKGFNVEIEHKKETFQGVKIYSFIGNISLTMVFLPIHIMDTSKNISLLHNPKYQTSEGTFTEFDKILARSLGRNLGLGGSYLIKGCNLDSLQILNPREVAQAGQEDKIITLFQAGRWISTTSIRGRYNTFSQGEKRSIQDRVGATVQCTMEKTPLDLMGNPSEGFHINAPFQKELGWLAENKRIIKFDVDHKTETSYSLSQEGQSGLKVVEIPFTYQYGSVTNPDDETFDVNIEGTSQKNYYLESRLNTNMNRQSLHINVLNGRDVFLFSNNGQNGLNLNESFYDKFNKIMLQVTDTNEKILTFKITPCDDEVNLFNIIPVDSTSIDNVMNKNVFESFFRSSINLNRPFNIISSFGLENTSNCLNREYTIDKKSVKISQGLTQILGYKFSDEKMKIKPHTNKIIGLTVNITINEQATYINTDSKIEFDIFTDMDSPNNPDNKQKYLQHLTIQFHAIPTPEEYRNDLEPFEITIINNNNPNSELNPLEIKKDQTLIFKTQIANNSRNPDGNKSSKFLVKFTIQNNKGIDAISPIIQQHDGIPPGNISQPIPFIWQIPANFQEGTYRIVIETDSNNRLHEFNENNNIIWKYITVRK